MQISLFLLISIFAFSSGEKLINSHLDRVLQGSANYGSGPNYSSVAKKSHASYGSGVESKYSSVGSGSKHGSNAKYGSYNQCSRTSRDYVFSSTISSGKTKHYSYAIKGSGAHRVSGSKGGSEAHIGSGAHGGSGAHRGSNPHKGSGPYIGSSPHKGSSSKMSSGAHRGSGSKGGSGLYIGSGPHKGSSSKGIGSAPYKGSSSKGGSNVPYNIFSPTMQPTEAEPPIYKLPPPTYYPTSSMNIPKIPLSFEKPTNEGIEVPLIPLSFQIEQGANGWAQYPDSPPLDSHPLDSHPLEKAFAQVAAKTAGVSANSIANMNVKKTSQRKLSATTKITVTYDIITNPASIGEKTQAETYYKIANKLALSVKNNNFSSDLHRLGIKLNISSIVFSNYAVFYPTLTPTSVVNVLSSPGASDHSSLTDSLVIGVGILLVIGVLVSFGWLYLNKKYVKKIEREVSLTESKPHIERVSNPMTDIIPDPLRRITITHTPTPTHSE